MSDTDSSLGESSATLDRRDQAKPKVKRHDISHYRPRHNLNNQEQLEQQRKASRPKEYFNISSGRPLGDKPRTTRRPLNIPPGSKMLGGFIIPPFFSFSRISKAAKPDASSPNPTQPVSNFFGNLFNRLKSPAKLFHNNVGAVNKAPNLDVVTGTRPSMREEEKKDKTRLDSYLADCLKKKSSIYSPVEKKKMRKVQEIHIREKEKERETERRKKEKEREHQARRRYLQLRKGAERKKGRGEVKRNGNWNAERGKGRGYKDEDSTLDTTDLSNEHPLFAREFREKVRIYTPSGTELNVDNNRGFSTIDHDVIRSRRRPKDDVKVEFSSRRILEEKRKKLQQLEFDPVREMETQKLIIEENRRTLREINMKTAKETLCPAPNMDADRTIEKTQTGGSGLKREPIKSSTTSSSDQSNIRSDIAASGSVIQQDVDNDKANKNKCREEKSQKKPVEMKACSTDMLLKKRKEEQRRKTESRDDTVNNEVEQKVNGKMKNRHKDKTVDVEAREKVIHQPDVKKFKIKRPEQKKSNTQGVESELDDSKNDSVQVIFLNKHFLKSKLDKNESPQAKPLVSTSSSGNMEHPVIMHHDQHNCAQTLNKEYIELDTVNNVEYCLEDNSATENTFTESVDNYAANSRDSVVKAAPSEYVVVRIPISKEVGTKHDYNYAEQGDSSDCIDARNASLRGIVPSTTTTTTCEREDSTLFRGHQRGDHRYGDVRLADDFIREETECRLVNTPSSTDEDTTTVSDCEIPQPSNASKASCRRWVHKKPKDTRSVLTTSQESMAEAEKQRSSAITARRVYLINKRNEAMKQRSHAGRRSQGCMCMTEKLDQVLKDGRALEADESDMSVMEVFEVIADDDTSSPDLETSTEHGLGFGSKTGVMLPKCVSRVLPKARKVGLVVARSKSSFHHWNKHNDFRQKVREIKEKNKVTAPAVHFVRQEKIQKEVFVPDQDFSTEPVIKPQRNVVKGEAERELDLKNHGDHIKEDTRAEVMQMLRTVQAKTEKLGRIRKLMEAMEEHSEIGDDPKRDILADMLLAVNLNGKEERANVKHLEKAVVNKSDDHKIEVGKHKRTLSQSPDTCIQQVQPVVATQYRKSETHSMSRANKHVASKEHQELDPPHTDHKKEEIQDESKTHRDEKKNIIVARKEYFEKVPHTGAPHKQTLGEDMGQETGKNKQHGGGRHSLAGECTAPQSQRDVGFKEVPNAISQHRAERCGDDVCYCKEAKRTQNEKVEELHVENVAKDRALANREINSMYARNDSSESWQEHASEIMLPNSVISSHLKEMEDTMATVLSEYEAKTREYQRLIKNHVSSIQHEMNNDLRQSNGDCTLECCGGQQRDFVQNNKETEIVHHMTTCCCAPSVRCNQVDDGVRGVEFNPQTDNTLSRHTVKTCKHSAQETNVSFEDREQVLKHNTTCNNGIKSHVLPSVLAERENIMSISHKYVKPLQFESDKLRMGCNCNNMTPDIFSKTDNFRGDCVIKTCNGDVSKEVRSTPNNNHVAGEPRVISLMEPRSNFLSSTSSVDENYEQYEGSVLNDHFKPEKPSTVRRSCVDKSHRTSDPNKEERAPQQRLAGGCIEDHNWATALNFTERQKCKPRQQLVGNMNPTCECRMGMAFRNLNPTSSDSTQHGLGSSRANNVREGFSREVEQVEDTHRKEKTPCRTEVTSTHVDSTNIASGINTPNKVLQEIFKTMHEVVNDRFLSLASINGITVAVTPQLVVKQNAEARSDEEKLGESTKKEFDCEEVGKKEKELCQEEVAIVDEGAGSSKQVYHKIVSVNEKSEMFPPQVYKNEHKMSLGNRAECPIPEDRGATSEKTLMDRIETMIGNQERIQELALRNSHQLESAASAYSCNFKRSDVYIIGQVLCKSLGAISREKKHAEMRLRRSKATKTRSKPWRDRRVNETPYGDSAAKQRRQVSAGEQMDAETSANLRLLEEIALLNVPDKTPFSPKKSNNFDRCYEQVLRCLPTEKDGGINSPEKELDKVSSQASSGEETRNGYEEVPVDCFLEKVRNNLNVDELQMLERASRTTVNVFAERKKYSKDMDLLYVRHTYDENNSTSTDVATPNIKAIKEVAADADKGSGHDNQKSMYECFGVDNINDRMKQLTPRDDVIANGKPSSRHGGRREWERRRGGGSHLKARHGDEQVMSHRRRKEDKTRREEQNEDDEETKVEAARKSHLVSDSYGTSKRRRDGTTTTTMRDNSIPSPEASFETKGGWKHRQRQSKVTNIDEWIRDGAVATRGSTKQEENFDFPSKSTKNSEDKRTEKVDLIKEDINPVAKFMMKYALKSGIILSGGGKMTSTIPGNNNSNDRVKVNIELRDNKETLIVIQLPEEDEFKVKRNSSIKTSIEPHSRAQIVHVDSEEIMFLDAKAKEASPPWTRAEQRAFREALNHYDPTPRVWNRIAKVVGRSKRDCVLHFIHIWKRLDGVVADGQAI